MSTTDLLTQAVPACPLCGGDDARPVDRIPDSLAAEINRYLPAGEAALPETLENRRVRCAGCGLVYLDPRLDGPSLQQVYRLWYGYAYRRVMTDPAHVEERRREFRDYHLRLLEAHRPRRGRLLDLGCGSGIFLGLAQRNGWTVTGVEFDALTAAWARDREGIADVRCGTLGTVLDPVERFDAITLFDYLEHSDRPGADLDTLTRHLAPGGALMVRVPNAGGWQARLMGPRWLAVMSTHLSYFDAPTLRQALVARGLVPQYLAAPNYRTEWEIVRQRLAWLRRRLGPATAPAQPAGDGPGPLVPPVGPLGGALQRWLASLWVEQVDHLGGWFSQGNMLTAIAARSAVAASDGAPPADAG
jgi:2-polyprenyl-3-methyl-5-hydroxy-6-metoxy-1,4-benzoquinol methylase